MKLKVNVQGNQFLFGIAGLLLILSAFFKWQLLQDEESNKIKETEYQERLYEYYTSYLPLQMYASNHYAQKKSTLSVPAVWDGNILEYWQPVIQAKPDKPVYIERIPTYLPTLMFVFAISVLIMSFIAKRRELEAINEALRYQANRDALTGVYNRQKFDCALKKQVNISKRYGTELSVIIFDADKFKVINDTQGHLVGDAVLKQIAEIARDNIRKADVLARWGGEEFVILTPSTNASGAEVLAEKLRRLIEQHDFGIPQLVSCSFGVAQLREEGNHETLVNRADIALYRAKTGGRNRVEINWEALADTVVQKA